MLKNDINVTHITAVLAEEEELKKQGYRKIYMKFEEEEKNDGFWSIFFALIQLIFSIISMVFLAVFEIVMFGISLFFLWSIWTI